MAIWGQDIDREGVYVARAKVSADPARAGALTFSLSAYTEPQGGGQVFLNMSPDDAELLAAMLLNAAIACRAAATQQQQQEG